MTVAASNSSGTMRRYRLLGTLDRLFRASSIEIGNINYTLQAYCQCTSQDNNNSNGILKYDFKEIMRFEEQEGAYMMTESRHSSMGNKTSKFKIIMTKELLKELYEKPNRPVKLMIISEIETPADGILFIDNELKFSSRFVRQMNQQTEEHAYELNIEVSTSKLDNPKGLLHLTEFKIRIVFPYFFCCKMFGDVLLLEFGLRYGIFAKHREPIHPRGDDFTWSDVLRHHLNSFIYVLIMFALSIISSKYL
ncbi:hypothetical protein WICANDRAFT_101488 [Wickerhamomyces anomalus NRRL Y-366-8]|uniref:Uncharacterized protein n=1 Tax=Wickerhamomyces anomalus (strain ATCC 58044 / CBS 1984 / NCYC 433 / NRRL Y-366-8) TaxID=683960 RepID=A0A1E3NYL9_WICAA|nr:uncharacterized protein WICANDRAFT_101488 [Wickerhamomyces anomalus NRRL Y-366-8]ODQ58208.1 hypothetical protein WICANDRAFT_101488 [Wickerhamomyces anomalus NRRL Y-366-8]